jgi:WD40 repeat protein
MRTTHALSIVIATLIASTAAAQFQAVANPGTIVRPKATLNTTDEAKGVAFSPDGRSIATTSAKSMQLWDASGSGNQPRATMPPNPNGHTQPLTSVAWMPDGKAVASAAKDGKIKLWDAQSGNRTAEADCGAGVTVRGLAVSPDGKTLIAGVGGVMWTFDAASLRKQAELRVNNEYMTPVRYTADGRTIITASDHGFMRFYDATSGRETRNWKSPDNAVAHAAASPDGRVVACAATVGANPKHVTIHDGANGRVLATVTVTDDVTGLALSSNGALLAVAVLDHTVKLVDASNGHVKATFTGHTDGPISVAFSADNMTLVSGAASSALLWSVPP